MSTRLSPRATWGRHLRLTSLSPTPVLAFPNRVGRLVPYPVSTGGPGFSYINHWGGWFREPMKEICLFILYKGFSMQKYCSASPFPSPVDRILSDLFTMTHPSWVDQHCITLTALSHTSPFAMTRGRGWQRMRWSDSITGSQDVKSGKLWETVEDGGA